MQTNRLTELRKERGLTQAEIAKRLGMAPTTYASYEQGRREPADDVKAQIADFYEVSIDYLLGRTNIRNAITAGNSGPTDIDDPTTVLRFEGRNIPKKDIELMMQIFRRMREEH